MKLHGKASTAGGAPAPIAHPARDPSHGELNDSQTDREIVDCPPDFYADLSPKERAVLWLYMLATKNLGEAARILSSVLDSDRLELNEWFGRFAFMMHVFSARHWRLRFELEAALAAFKASPDTPEGKKAGAIARLRDCELLALDFALRSLAIEHRVSLTNLRRYAEGQPSPYVPIFPGSSPDDGAVAEVRAWLGISLSAKGITR